MALIDHLVLKVVARLMLINYWPFVTALIFTASRAAAEHSYSKYHRYDNDISSSGQRHMCPEIIHRVTKRLRIIIRIIFILLNHKHRSYRR